MINVKAEFHWLENRKAVNSVNKSIMWVLGEKNNNIHNPQTKREKNLKIESEI